MSTEVIGEQAASEPASPPAAGPRSLDFDRLIARLSTRFINLPAEEGDEAFRDALGRIGDALGLDRCAFYWMEPDAPLIDHAGWAAVGATPKPAPRSIWDALPWTCKLAFTGGVASFSSLDEIPNPTERASRRSEGTRSGVTVPLTVTGRIVGSVAFHTERHERRWLPDEIQNLRVMATAFGNFLTRRESEATLRRMLTDLERRRDELHAENVYLRRETQQQRCAPGIVVGQSPAIKRVLDQIRQVAATDSTVLLLGETGTGKELFATQIHELSARHGREMVRVNCAAIPATLMESELYGREKGAFTGALARQIGRFELADHSTIFLDEIGDLPEEVQVKLLRVLEERQFERLGSPRAIRVDTRIIAATHRDIERRIAEGRFREDLFYRLNVFPIKVPPLRERPEDIPLLVWRFVDEFSKAFGKRIDAISRDNMATLQQYAWPGNIRELRNVVERAMIVATGPRLGLVLPVPTAAPAKSSVKLADVEKEHIRSVLESTGWRIRGAGAAADRLGLKPTTLETRLAKLGLCRPKPF